MSDEYKNDEQKEETGFEQKPAEPIASEKTDAPQEKAYSAREQTGGVSDAGEHPDAPAQEPIPEWQRQSQYNQQSSVGGQQVPPHTGAGQPPYGSPYWGGQPYRYQNPSEQDAAQMKGKKKKKSGVVVALVVVIVLLLLVSAGLTGTLIYNFYYADNSSSGTVPPEGLPEPSADAPQLEITNPPTTPSGGDASADGALTPAQIYEKVGPSVVSVLSESLSNMTQSTGSGIVMTEDGYIITNNHVVEEGDQFTVVMSDGTEYSAQIIGTDSKTDLAVLKIEATGLTPAEFGDSDALKIGDLAIAIGSPGGLELQNSMTRGIISAINRNIAVDGRTMNLIQTDASINPGNSGGPLINQYGQVIGINTVKLGISYYEGLGFAIPMNTAKPIIDELTAYGHVVGRPAIGITGQNLSANMAAYFDLPQGILVGSIDPDGPAYGSGLQTDDIITHVNGERVTTMQELIEIKDQYKAGDQMTLTIYRGGRKYEFTITLMDEAVLTDLQEKRTQSQQQQQPSSGSEDGSTNPFGGGNGGFTFPW